MWFRFDGFWFCCGSHFPRTYMPPHALPPHPAHGFARAPYAAWLRFGFRALRFPPGLPHRARITTPFTTHLPHFTFGPQVDAFLVPSCHLLDRAFALRRLTPRFDCSFPGSRTVVTPTTTAFPHPTPFALPAAAACTFIRCYPTFVVRLPPRWITAHTRCHFMVDWVPFPPPFTFLPQFTRHPALSYASYTLHILTFTFTIRFAPAPPVSAVVHLLTRTTPHLHLPAETTQAPLLAHLTLDRGDVPCGWLNV